MPEIPDGRVRRLPQFVFIVVTHELVDNTWIATVGHSFYGDTEEEANRVMEAHKKTDRFFAAGFTGQFDGITVMNSEPQLYRTGEAWSRLKKC